MTGAFGFPPFIGIASGARRFILAKFVAEAVTRLQIVGMSQKACGQGAAEAGTGAGSTLWRPPTSAAKSAPIPDQARIIRPK